MYTVSDFQTFITLSKQNWFSAKQGCAVLVIEDYFMQNINLQISVVPPVAL